MDINQPKICRQEEGQEQQIIQQEQREEKDIKIIKTCEFFITRKRRLCKFPVVEASKYCAAHCSDQQNKIECPYEKGMFIDAAKFEKHLLICPRIKNKKVQQQSQWYSKGVNLNNNQKEKQAQTFDSILDIGNELLTKVVRKIIGLFLKEFGPKVTYYLCSSEQEKIPDLTNDHTQAFLLAESAFRLGLIRKDIIYIEFGAGKGILSYHLAKKVKDQCKGLSKNVLLERQTRRNKFDRYMKDNPYFQRFKSDVSDFDVSKLPQTMAQTAFEKKPDLIVEKETAELNQLQIVGVCKHMCGAALDISLRALMKTKMSGCILASCCHHLCSYETYLNNQFFQQNNFAPEQIQVLFKISAWGTKSTTIKDEEINFEDLLEKDGSAINGKNKVAIGRMCKRLIDFGRAQILGCQLVRYCSDQITPENFVIISK